MSLYPPDHRNTSRRSISSLKSLSHALGKIYVVIDVSSTILKSKLSHIFPNVIAKDFALNDQTLCSKAHIDAKRRHASYKTWRIGQISREITMIANS